MRLLSIRESKAYFVRNKFPTLKPKVARRLHIPLELNPPIRRADAPPFFLARVRSDDHIAMATILMTTILIITRRFNLPTARFFVRQLLLVICAFSAATALAEKPALNESPGETPGEISAPANYSPVAIERAALPDAPVPQAAKVRVIDRKFVIVMAALAGSETLRFTTHKLVLDHELAAGAPWVTSVPPNRHLVLKFGAIYGAELLVAYELKKPHSWLPGDRLIQKLWWAYPAVMTPIHLKNGIRSIRTKPPADIAAGTSVEDCPPEYQQYCGGQ